MPRLFSFLLIFFASFAFAVDCPNGQISKGGVCVSVCKAKQGVKRHFTWDSYLYGTAPSSSCSDVLDGVSCEADRPTFQYSSDVTGRLWSGDFTFNGNACSNPDTFSGGTPAPFPYEGDANMNGIPDSDEDFDMDGIPNHSDPNPDKNDNLVTDSDGDNIPDSLEQHYQDLLDMADSEVVTLDCAGKDCLAAHRFNDAVVRTSKNQKDLINIIDYFVKNGLSKSGLSDALSTYNGELAKYINKLESRVTTEIYSLKGQVYKSMSESRGVIRDVNNQLASIDTRQSQAFRGITSDLSSLDDKLDNMLPTLYYAIKAAENAAKNTKYAVDSVANSVSLARKDITSTKSSVEALSTTLAANTKSINQLKKTVKNDIGSMKSSLSDVANSVESNGSKLDALKTAVDSLDTGSGGNGNGTGQDYSGALTGISNGISDIKKAISGQNKFQAPSSDFDPNGLISSDAKQTLQDDIESLREDMATQYDEFKNILSFDTDSFQDGEYHEHVLDLTVNGQQQSFKTGVLAALLENADIIKAVILFLFVLMGIRMLGGE